MSGLQWRRFAREDWDAYGGAEAFPGGGEPWIAELEVDGEYGVAILDATGLCVMAGEEQEVWIAVRRGASYEAAGAVGPETTTLALRALGYLPLSELDTRRHPVARLGDTNRLDVSGETP